MGTVLSSPQDRLAGRRRFSANQNGRPAEALSLLNRRPNEEGVKMRRLLVLLVTVIVLGARPAEAIPLRDIIELSKGGLSDEILLALIDLEKRVYPIDPATLKQLKDAGVSDRVILAVVRSGRTQPEPVAPPVPPAPVVPTHPAPVAPAPAPPPQVVVIDHHDRPAAPAAVAVPVPVYVPVVAYPVQRRWPHPPQQPIAPFSTIGLPHPRFGLSAPPPKPTSDPPYWKQQQQR